MDNLRENFLMERRETINTMQNFLTLDKDVLMEFISHSKETERGMTMQFYRMYSILNEQNERHLLLNNLVKSYLDHNHEIENSINESLYNAFPSFRELENENTLISNQTTNPLDSVRTSGGNVTEENLEIPTNINNNSEEIYNENPSQHDDLHGEVNIEVDVVQQPLLGERMSSGNNETYENTITFDIPIRFGENMETNYRVDPNIRHYRRSSIPPIASNFRTPPRMPMRRRSNLRYLNRPTISPPPPPRPPPPRPPSTYVPPLTTYIPPINTENTVISRRIGRRNAIVRNPPGLEILRNRHLGNNNIPENLSPVPIIPTQQQISLATSRHRYVDISNECHYDRCPISLIDFENEDIILRIDHCGHIFRESSILVWFSQHSTCPNCRRDIRESSSNELHFANAVEHQGEGGSTDAVTQTFNSNNVRNRIRSRLLNIRENPIENTRGEARENEMSIVTANNGHSVSNNSSREGLTRQESQILNDVFLNTMDAIDNHIEEIRNLGRSNDNDDADTSQ